MQLLEITSVPMRYEYSVQSARLEQSTQRGGYTMQKQGGTFEMRTQPTRYQQDSTQFRNSLGLMDTTSAREDWSARNKRAGTEAVARYVDFGNQISQIQKGASIPDILFARMMQDKGMGNLTVTRPAPVEASWTQPQFDMSYTPVTQTFDWQMAKNTMEFIPGKFTMNIMQYPEVRIKYLGKPNYVPPSAAPDYQGTA